MSARWYSIPLLVFGVFCCSTAVIMIKSSSTDPVLLSALRLFVAAGALSPLFVMRWRQHRHAYTRAHLLATLFPGVLLAVHFVSWIIGARLAPAANSSLIVNLVPIVMPLMLAATVHERLTKTEMLATATAIAGVLLLSVFDFNTSRAYFWGDVICFGSMLAFAYYLVQARKNQALPSLWLYVVPLYAVAGVLCLAAALFRVNPLTQPYPLREILLILGLGLVPTVLGHSILNLSMKHLRGQVVSILNMGQFIFAGVMAYFLRDEVPGWAFYVAASLIAMSAYLVVAQSMRRREPEPKGAESTTGVPAAEPV
jgi:drug/metabolite transporter (DMT)-like permease